MRYSRIVHPAKALHKLVGTMATKNLNCNNSIQKVLAENGSNISEVEAHRHKSSIVIQKYVRRWLAIRDYRARVTRAEAAKFITKYNRYNQQRKVR